MGRRFGCEEFSNDTPGIVGVWHLVEQHTGVSKDLIRDGIIGQHGSYVEIERH